MSLSYKQVLLVFPLFFPLYLTLSLPKSFLSLPLFLSHWVSLLQTGLTYSCLSSPFPLYLTLSLPKSFLSLSLSPSPPRA
ncbi:hypothetical protein XELAEV_18030284mg [Xenopus laevis]|uniref:Uncharacterized protein n=1 Tax=Xenopus laevis TaxID=8355 RepID=A0A974HIU9_XENLA|nr:hypothetical protein XELAEV_18030284mg [Xenopus laevis]